MLKHWRIAVVLFYCGLTLAAGYLVFSQPRSAVGPTIIQGDQSINVAEAREQFPPGVPDSAKNIHYAAYAEFVAFEEFVKYDAPLDDCVEQAKKIIADYNAENPDRPVPDLTPIIVPEPKEVWSSELTLMWFDPESIKTGFVGGEIGNHEPKVWVDTKRGILCYRCTD